MKEKTKLQPNQIMFLKYLLTLGDSLDYSVVSRIKFSLKLGEYITRGPNSYLFNRLRNNYMEDFEMFEVNLNNTK